MRWPFVWARTLEQVTLEYGQLRTENFTLRDALREANAELVRHRRLIAGLRTGDPEVTRAIEKARTA